MADNTYFPQIGLALEEPEEMSLGVSYFSRPGGVVMKTTAEFDSDKGRISERNIIYVYTDYKEDSEGVTHPGIKIGDGKAYIVDLPFATGFSASISGTTEETIEQITEELKTKVSTTIATDDSENLVFYN